VLSEKADGKMAKAGLLKPKQYKPKKCKWCRQIFTPERNLQSVCSFECTIAQMKAKQQQRMMPPPRPKKKPVHDLKWWLKHTQIDCNAVVRMRDQLAGLPCISCGVWRACQHHAGHFRPLGNNPAIRFDLANIHRQCAPCNNHHSGNLTGNGGGAGYEANLVAKIGQAEVDRLKASGQAYRWSIDELQALRVTFKAMLKQMQQNAGGL
jgi:hypothetical protein